MANVTPTLRKVHTGLYKLLPIASLGALMGILGLGLSTPAIAQSSGSPSSDTELASAQDAIAPASLPATESEPSPEPITSESVTFESATSEPVAEVPDQPIAAPVPALAQVNGPVTSVSNLTDVDPSHWAFSALRQLIEEHQCIAGDSDRQFQGDRALTRYEFAAALNACLEGLQQKLEAATDEGVSEDDLIVIRRLQEEFRAELSTLERQVAGLEERVDALENQQFSTTAVLGGEVIFGLAAASAGETPGDGDREATFSHLTRLQLVSSFTGRDRLRLQLSA
ncbi:MAG: iron uptake porin, partial [Cyanobacteria bacterium P01_H01_bin.130]